MIGKNEVWLNAYADYLIQNDITDNFFWCVNPNSKTEGLLKSDWITPETDKLLLLKKVVPNPTKILDLINEQNLSQQP